MNCRCGGVQSEMHILLHCDERITDRSVRTTADVFKAEDQVQSMKVIHDTLQQYEIH